MLKYLYLLLCIVLVSCEHKLKQGEIYPVLQNGKLVIVNNSDRDQKSLSIHKIGKDSHVFVYKTPIKAKATVNTNIPIDSIRGFFYLLPNDKMESVFYRLEQDNMKLDSFTIDEVAQIKTFEDLNK